MRGRGTLAMSWLTIGAIIFGLNSTLMRLWLIVFIIYLTFNYVVVRTYKHDVSFGRLINMVRRSMSSKDAGHPAVFLEIFLFGPARDFLKLFKH